MTNVLGALFLGAAILVAGCAKPKPCACEVPRACCRGLVPQCAACEEGLTLEEWFKKTCADGETDAHYGGWDEAAQKTFDLEDEDRKKLRSRSRIFPQDDMYNNPVTRSNACSAG